MRKLSKILTAAALAATTATSFAIPADARHHRHHYYGRTAYRHKYCRRSSGTTGLVAGGVAGAVVGHGLLGHGLLGTAAGAVGGAVAGRAIDRSATAPRRCYYR
jgi:outer membrane lipoprotein SlyB